MRTNPAFFYESCPFCGSKWKIEYGINMYGRCRATCTNWVDCGVIVEGSDPDVLLKKLKRRPK